MRMMSKLLAVSVTLLALPALAQTVDGGIGTLSCTVDKDCGDVCGWVCDWNLGKVCVPAIQNTASPGSEGIGWCDQSSDCACPGQTCSGTSCTPPSFTNTQPQCVCDSDCPANQHCDSTLEMCEPAGQAACNYSGECGCGCFCINGACECTGVLPEGACSSNADCGPACYGFSCEMTQADGGTCEQNYAQCVIKNPDGGSSSSSSSGNSSSGGLPSSASMGGSSSSGSMSMSGSSSGSTVASSSSGSSTSVACFQVGTACAQNSDCCNQYCDKSVCTCNKAETPGKYPCVTQADCCSGTCTAGLCVGGATSGTTGTTGSAGGSSSSGSASASGSSSSGSSAAKGDGGTSSSSGGCSCGTGAGAVEGLALAALGFAFLIRRKRLA